MVCGGQRWGGSDWAVYEYFVELRTGRYGGAEGERKIGRGKLYLYYIGFSHWLGGFEALNGRLCSETSSRCSCLGE